MVPKSTQLPPPHLVLGLWPCKGHRAFPVTLAFGRSLSSGGVGAGDYQGMFGAREDCAASQWGP